MEPIRFSSRIRYWNPDTSSGLAVADLPAAAIRAIGGLKQQRVRGTANGVDFASSVMPGGGGRLALSVSKAMMKSAAVSIGGEIDVVISGVGRD